MSKRLQRKMMITYSSIFGVVCVRTRRRMLQGVAHDRKLGISQQNGAPQTQFFERRIPFFIFVIVSEGKSETQTSYTISDSSLYIFK